MALYSLGLLTLHSPGFPSIILASLFQSVFFFFFTLSPVPLPNFEVSWGCIVILGDFIQLHDFKYNFVLRTPPCVHLALPFPMSFSSK